MGLLALVDLLMVLSKVVRLMVDVAMAEGRVCPGV
jgi:hypothetical protein